MPIQSGTATDHKDLLDQLRIFALANGWVSEAYTTQAGLETTDQLFLRGLGSTTTENVHVNIQTFGDAFNDVWSWEVFGATSYDNTQPIMAQPNASPQRVYFRATNNAMNYWFYISDRRIIVVIQAATSFFAMYAGFFLPFSSPLDYPFPLYIAATSINQESIATLNAGSRNFADPGGENSNSELGLSAAYLRDQTGQWFRVQNHSVQSNQDDQFDPDNPGVYYTHPYGNGAATNQPLDYLNPAQWDIRPPAGAPTIQPLFPINFMPGNPVRPMIGLLENAFYTPGFGVSSNQTFQTGTQQATGLLTLTGNAVAGETVTIGTDQAAVADLQAGANFADGDTVTIDGKTYTFQAVLTNVDGNVFIGADATTTMANLAAAINLDAGAGTLYAAATTVHPTVSATSVLARLSITAKTAGSAANAIVLAVTGGNAYWTSATMRGGADATVYTFRATVDNTSPIREVVIGASAADTRDNLVSAINAATGAGSMYSLGTPFNPFVRAESTGAQNMTARSREFGTVGNAIATADTMTNASWGTATLTGGGANETYRIFQNGSRTGSNHFFAVLEV